LTVEGDSLNVDDRQRCLDSLGVWALECPKILAAVLVGSGVAGFRDQHSDLDVLYVTEPGAVKGALAWATLRMTEQLAPRFSTLYQHRDDVFVLCSLLSSGLEIDLGIWPVDILFAVRPAWRVVSARDEAGRLAVEASLREHPVLARPYEPIISGDDPLWLRAQAWKVARARGEAATASSLCLRLAHYVGAPSDAALLAAVVNSHARTVYDERQQQMIGRLMEPAARSPQPQRNGSDGRH
jgi:hypothetical protein